MELATVNNQTMTIKEYKGQRVLTFKDIDASHNRPNGTAGRAFRNNRKHFIEGTDFFKVSPDEFRRTMGNMDKRQCNSVFVFTESGYLMLAKSFTDELAWTVQRQLVNCYFRCKGVTKRDTPQPTKGEQLTLETSEYFYFDKTFHGEPVITLADFEHFTGVSADCAAHCLKKHCTPTSDYHKLSGSSLLAFKRENPQYNRGVNCVIVVTKSGFVSLMKYYGCKMETPKCFIENKKPLTVVEKLAMLSDEQLKLVSDLIKSYSQTQSNSSHSLKNNNVNDCVIALGVLGNVRDNLTRTENTEAVSSINEAIKYTAWELSKRITA